ncbi:5-methyltetrahydropteroyltriglutamate-homocysteine S-methyltransferase [Radiomyces spectabilis]|uniref:5-methyltetrahydropteroyltriglutamate- homocysteine S-methyltransferase n=1 Tax=Radiomyces spectabilis TaxID=64574 RepID=UPI002220F22A|nr:5-methyltetrahydropteroyltriglutamate-homocysteine S-methyltransferase [Radiomyces spectabilis]KAI8366796.1 5-methyltetrahydropteroyltriglutamate-homocysteine S-methyltransferase [Radiomyces spectabilis]
MVVATNLGFPYVGAKRELKKLIESYWSGKISEADLKSGYEKIQADHWKLQKEQGLEHIPSGEYTLYDRVLDTAQQFGAIPQRYQHIKNPLEQFFAMGRGLQKAATETTEKVDVPAMEMKKWFDTNYHFIVPEFEQDQTFTLQAPRAVEQFKAAKALGIHTRPVLVGPVTFLHLGKAAKNAGEFDTLSLLPKVLPQYVELLKQLEAAGADWVQIDEPILILDLKDNVKAALETAYKTLKASTSLKLLVAAYFGRVESNILSVKDHVDAIHLDLVRAPEELDTVLPLLTNNQILSLGLVDGRNIWINNLAKSLELAEKAIAALGKDRVFIAPSCSLAHSPFSTSFEKKIQEKNPELFSWLSFSVEKCAEIVTIAKALNEGRQAVQGALEKNAAAVESRRTSPQTTNPAVRERVAQTPASAWKRPSAFAVRREAQVKKLKLPLFPTTTIGSFPQTKEIRVARQKFNKGELAEDKYNEFIKAEMKRAVEFQEKVGLDVFVHGEPERNDMVEHFGHLLHGYAFTENGWVVSYGSRCVKPPVIFGDVSRRRPMTIDEIVYAQSLTQKPMKGMLTGPVTMMKWSFVRDDIPAKDLCAQIGLALRDEVVDLEAAGIPCIQVDEPAIREGLPIRRADWDAYLDWSVACFRLSTAGVRDETQIHTHMCYSDFNDIFDAIAALDADVITIENSKSDEKLLNIFETKQYTNEIGPGLYDIHSPRVPSVEEMKQRFGDMLKYLPAHLLWANPDCGLKSRGWPEVEAALINMVEVAKYYRAQHQQ